MTNETRSAAKAAFLPASAAALLALALPGDLAGYTPETIAELLGAEASDALEREQRLPALRAARAVFGQAEAASGLAEAARWAGEQPQDSDSAAGVARVPSGGDTEIQPPSAAEPAAATMRLATHIRALMLRDPLTRPELEVAFPALVALPGAFDLLFKPLNAETGKEEEAQQRGGAGVGGDGGARAEAEGEPGASSEGEGRAESEGEARVGGAGESRTEAAGGAGIDSAGEGRAESGGEKYVARFQIRAIAVPEHVRAAAHPEGLRTVRGPGLDLASASGADSASARESTRGHESSLAREHFPDLAPPRKSVQAPEPAPGLPSRAASATAGAPGQAPKTVAQHESEATMCLAPHANVPAVPLSQIPGLADFPVARANAKQDAAASPSRQAILNEAPTNILVASDWGELVGLRPGPEHVMPVGGATRSLMALAAYRPGQRVLDVGTGCGIHAILAALAGARVTATDISPRALGFARLNAALAGVTLDLCEGSLLEPVAGEEFDAVVSNPPFVITPDSVRERARFTYRDGGMPGDSLVSSLLTALPGVLAEGGRAWMLANWEVRGTWEEPVREWTAGLDAWAICREELSPARYAEMWLRDGGLAPGSPGYEEAYSAWIEDFGARGVRAIAMGFLLLGMPGVQPAPLGEAGNGLPRLLGSPGSGGEAVRATGENVSADGFDWGAFMPEVSRPEASRPEASGDAGDAGDAGGMCDEGVRLPTESAPASSPRGLREPTFRLFQRLAGPTPPAEALHEYSERVWANRAFAGAGDAELAGMRLRVVQAIEQRLYMPGAPEPFLIKLSQLEGFGEEVQLTTEGAAAIGACDGELTLGEISDAVRTLLPEVELAERSPLIGGLGDLVRNLAGLAMIEL